MQNKTESKLNLVVIGMHDYRSKLTENELNFKTWKSMSPFFTEINVIASSTNSQSHLDKYQNISLYLIPKYESKIISLIIFWIRSIIYVYKLNGFRNLILDASEPVGAGIPVIVLKYLLNSKAVIELQGEVFTPSQYGYIIPIISRVISQFADVVRVVSHSLKDAAIENGISPEKILYVPTRVDVGVFSPKTNQYDVDKNKTAHLLFIGNLVPLKGVNYLIDALEIVFKKFDNIKLLIVGDGPQKSNLMQYSHEKKLAHIIDFVGRIPHNTVPTFFDKGVVFILPSLTEGMPRVILESMACGVPVIASSVGGIPELIEHNKTGLLFAPTDVLGLSQSILKLLTDEKLRYHIITNGYAFVTSNFSHSVGITKMVDMYYYANSR